MCSCAQGDGLVAPMEQIIELDVCTVTWKPYHYNFILRLTERPPIFDGASSAKGFLFANILIVCSELVNFIKSRRIFAVL